MRISNIGPLIAVLLSSVLSFTAGYYLPYVIAAVSGSGAIAAVPLAIFAVSTVVALISVTYLFKLVISRADNKKEAGLNGEELGQSGHTASQEPVCKNCTNLGNKPIGKESNNPVELGTQPNPSASVPPPPPPPLPQGAAPPPGFLNSSTQPYNVGLSVGIENIKLKKTDGPEQNKPLPAGADGKLIGLTEELKTKFSKDGVKNKMKEEYTAKIEREQEERRKQNEENAKKESGIASILVRRKEIEFSDSESEDEHESGVSDSEWEDEYATPQIPQSNNKKRSESPDSGCASGDDANSKPASPSHSAPKAEKPSLPPKPANLQTRSKAPPETKVNGGIDTSKVPFNDARQIFSKVG